MFIPLRTLNMIGRAVCLNESVNFRFHYLNKGNFEIAVNYFPQKQWPEHQSWNTILI